MEIELKSLNTQIEVLERKLAALKQMRDNLLKQQEDSESEVLARDNALNSIFDAVKTLANPLVPLPLVLPQLVVKDMYYKVNDGAKTTKYVAKKSGVVKQSNFDEYLEAYA